MSLLLVRSLWTFVLALLCAATSLASESAATFELHEARFQRSADAAEQIVSLPDTWAQRGLPQQAGTARYSLRFDLAAVPTEMWALRIDRLSTVHRVVLNGRVLHEQGLLDDPNVRPRGWPSLLMVPPTMLNAGGNDLELELRVGPRGAGLSTVQAGPASALAPAFERDTGFAITLPKMLNVAAAAHAVFMLLIWWRRRSETAIGLFGLLWLLASVRNYGHYVAATSLPSNFNSWLYYAVQNATTGMVGLFAIALSGRDWPRLRRLFLAAAIGLPLLGAVAAALGQLDTMRSVAYPLLMPILPAALWVLWAAARRLRGRALAGLVLGLAVVALSGWHDYAYLDGWVPVTDSFWLPYTIPPAFACFALALVGHLVTAMDQAEDLTQRLEARVAERTEQLSLANAAKTRFLAAASHDMRQPVVTIGLLLDLLREQLDAAPLRAMIDRIHEAAISLEVLLKGLMDLSRLDSGTIRPRLQSVPIAPLFDAIDLHHQTAAASKGLQLRFRPTTLAVTSDPTLLDQVLRNLVDNAIRYTDRGGVLVGARRRRDSVLLQVWDTGRGIAAESQSLVFEEFVQLDNPGRERNKGLGLGLAIVQRGMRLLGQRIWLRSTPGRGSCFTLELPLAAHSASTPQPATVPTLPLAGLLIWLIEDDAAVRDAMVARLRQWGAQVHALSCRADVERQLADASPLPALIVSDQRLPDGTGVHCVALVRERAARFVPALIVTGDTAPSDIARLAASGLPILHKPFSGGELLSSLQQSLRTPEASAA